MSDPTYGFSSAPEQRDVEAAAQRAAAQQAAQQGQPHTTQLAGSFAAPQPVVPGQLPPSSTDLSEEAWRASLPSWGDPINTGQSTAPPAAGTVAPPAPPAPVAPAAQQGSLLGTGFGLGPATLSDGMTLPAIDPSSDAAGLTQHTLTRTSAGFPIVAAQGASVAPVVSTAYRNWNPPPASGNTSAIWWLVLQPLLYSVALTGVMVAVLGSTLSALLSGLQMSEAAFMNAVAEGLTTYNLIALAVALVYLVTLIWSAYRDRAALRARGFDSVASPWWLLLAPLIYLILRTVYVRRITGKGAAPLVTYIVIYVVLPIAAVAAVIGFVISLSSM